MNFETLVEIPADSVRSLLLISELLCTPQLESQKSVNRLFFKPTLASLESAEKEDQGGSAGWVLAWDSGDPASAPCFTTASLHDLEQLLTLFMP